MKNNAWVLCGFALISLGVSKQTLGQFQKPVTTEYLISVTSPHFEKQMKPGQFKLFKQKCVTLLELDKRVRAALKTNHDEEHTALATLYNTMLSRIFSLIEKAKELDAETLTAVHTTILKSREALAQQAPTQTTAPTTRTDLLALLHVLASLFDAHAPHCLAANSSFMSRYGTPLLLASGVGIILSFLALKWIWPSSEGEENDGKNKNKKKSDNSTKEKPIVAQGSSGSGTNEQPHADTAAPPGPSNALLKKDSDEQTPGTACVSSVPTGPSKKEKENDERQQAAERQRQFQLKQAEQNRVQHELEKVVQTKLQRQQTLKREHMEQKNAAKTLQNAYRQHRERVAQHTAATAVQSCYRRHRARKQVAQMRQERQEKQQCEAEEQVQRQENAATKIQSAYRGRQARKDVAALSQERQRRDRAATTLQSFARGHRVRQRIAQENVAAKTIQGLNKIRQAKKRRALKRKKRKVLARTQVVADRAQAHAEQRMNSQLDRIIHEHVQAQRTEAAITLQKYVRGRRKQKKIERIRHQLVLKQEEKRRERAKHEKQRLQHEQAQREAEESVAEEQRQLQLKRDEELQRQAAVQEQLRREEEEAGAERKQKKDAWKAAVRKKRTELHNRIAEAGSDSFEKDVIALLQLPAVSSSNSSDEESASDPDDAQTPRLNLLACYTLLDQFKEELREERRQSMEFLSSSSSDSSDDDEHLEEIGEGAADHTRQDQEHEPQPSIEEIQKSILELWNEIKSDVFRKSIQEIKNAKEKKTKKDRSFERKSSTSFEEKHDAICIAFEHHLKDTINYAVTMLEEHTSSFEKFREKSEASSRIMRYMMNSLERVKEKTSEYLNLLRRNLDYVKNLLGYVIPKLPMQDVYPVQPEYIATLKALCKDFQAPLLQKYGTLSPQKKSKQAQQLARKALALQGRFKAILRRLNQLPIPIRHNHIETWNNSVRLVIKNMLESIPLLFKHSETDRLSPNHRRRQRSHELQRGRSEWNIRRTGSRGTSTAGASPTTMTRAKSVGSVRRTTSLLQ